MNIDNLELNKKYKYKELCSILGQDEKGRGNSRDCQLQDWARYFNMHKPNPRGHFYIVDEIYQTPKTKIDNRGKSENSRNAITVYAEYIDNLLLSDLVSRPKVFYTTVNNIAEMSHMVNSNYKVALGNYSTFETYCRVRHQVVNETAYNNCFYHIKGLVKPTIEGSMNRLARKGYLTYVEGYTVKVEASLTHANGLNKGETVRMADNNEEDIINEAKESVLLEFGVDSLNQIKGQKLTEYFNKVEYLVKESCPHVIQLWKGYEITKLSIDDNHRLSNEMKGQQESTLNNLILDKIYNTIETQALAIKNKINSTPNSTTFGVPNTTCNLEWYESNMIRSDYQANIKFLVNFLIDRKEPRVTIVDMWKEISKAK